MDIKTIAQHWVRKEGDVEAEVAAWDLVAGEYLREKKQNFNDDPFLQFLLERVPLEAQTHVLDVGCGAGAYAEAVAERAGQVVGVDFSPEMVRLAQSSAREHHIQNLQYLKRDWHTCDGREFQNKYDFVYAHTTPAVLDYATFMKLYQSSTRFGMFCRPARRTDSVFDEIYRIAEIPSRHNDESIAYTYDLLWALGTCPEVRYHQVVWHSEKTRKDAEIWYCRRLRGFLEQEPEKRKAIREFLESVAQGGIIREEIQTTLVTFFWERPDSEES